MENGSDLRSRVVMLEQRLTTLSQSLHEVIKIVRGVSWELSGVVGEINAELLRDREEEGRRDLDTLRRLDQRLAILDEALEKVPDPP